MDEWISKKELLKVTGISYGQLYRWKREGLIPDKWFVKRSVYTGQETFLPRERILERIQFILDSKDSHSFQEIAAMLSPDANSRIYEAAMLMAIPNTLTPMGAMMDITGTEKINHAQALLILLAARASRTCSLSESEISTILKALWKWQKEFNLTQQSDGAIALLKTRAGLIPLYLHRESALEAGADGRIVFHMTITDMQTEFTKKLNELEEE